MNELQLVVELQLETKASFSGCNYYRQKSSRDNIPLEHKQLLVLGPRDKEGSGKWTDLNTGCWGHSKGSACIPHLWSAHESCVFSSSLANGQM